MHRRAMALDWGRPRARWCWSPGSAARPTRRSPRPPRAQPRLPRGAAQPGGAESARPRTADRALPGAWPAKCRWSASTCSRPWAGFDLGVGFWTRFAAIEQRRGHQGRAVQPLSDARRDPRHRRGRRRGRITLYTGNDDHIVLDLLTPFALMRDGQAVDAALSRRAARPLVGLDPQRRRSCSSVAGGRRAGASTPNCSRSTAASPTATARFFDVANEFSRLHRRLPRGAAPPGPARRQLVPRPRRDARPGPNGPRSIASAANTATWPMTLRRDESRPLAGLTRALPERHDRP